jgi:hypothetical protein
VLHLLAEIESSQIVGGAVAVASMSALVWAVRQVIDAGGKQMTTVLAKVEEILTENRRAETARTDTFLESMRIHLEALVRVTESQTTNHIDLRAAIHELRNERAVQMAARAVMEQQKKKDHPPPSGTN